MRTKKAPIKASDLKEILVNQKYKCALTGQLLTPETAALDHKHPLSREGQHEVANVWIVHHAVNKAKGTMLIDEFISMCRLVVAWADRSESEAAHEQEERGAVMNGGLFG